ncbi:hypothetical protein DXG01_009766 [Tephrocybe rancida]|nr:hypothetical protein DXG01_009766 [Tephrocybe rancida]
MSEEVDTEEDPVDPITPLPNARFSIPRSAGSGKDADDGEDNGERMERDMYDEGDIEDDWVVPSVPAPIPSDPPAILVSSTSAGVPSVVHAKMPKKARMGRGRIEVPVPVLLVKIPVPMPSSNRDQEHFPFLMTQREKEVSPSRPEHRVRHMSIKNTGKRMHMARARDGGRTQSGGVKEILPDDNIHREWTLARQINRLSARSPFLQDLTSSSMDISQRRPIESLPTSRQSVLVDHPSLLAAPLSPAPSLVNEPICGLLTREDQWAFNGYR